MKRPWFLRLARGYARRRLARSFAGVHVDGLDEVRAAALQAPLLLCANHLSWWDAFVAVVVDEALGTDGHCLMDEANLQRLPFFSAIGAVPLSMRDPRRALTQLAAAGALLNQPGRAMWIFPQGKEAPSWRRPLGFRRGFVRVLEQAPGALVVPVSILIVFSSRPEPLLVVRLHKPRAFVGDARATTRDLEDVVAGGLDDLDAGLARGALPPLLVRGTAGVDESTFATRLLVRSVGAP